MKTSTLFAWISLAFLLGITLVYKSPRTTYHEDRMFYGQACNKPVVDDLHAKLCNDTRKRLEEN